MSSQGLHLTTRVDCWAGVVRAVLVGTENHAPNDAVYAARKPRVSTPDRVFHLQTGMYVFHNKQFQLLVSVIDKLTLGRKQDQRDCEFREVYNSRE